MSFKENKIQSVTMHGSDYAEMRGEIIHLRSVLDLKENDLRECENAIKSWCELLALRTKQRNELLEACQDFVNAVRAGSKQEIMLAIDAADKKARAAIEKAKGVENETAT